MKQKLAGIDKERDEGKKYYKYKGLRGSMVEFLPPSLKVQKLY